MQLFAPDGLHLPWRGAAGGEAVHRQTYIRRVAKSTSIFSCSACGQETPKWHGRCPGCGEWNTIVESAVPSRQSPGRQAGRALRPVALADVQAPAVQRLSTGIGEFDRVLGGGLVPGSLVLIG